MSYGLRASILLAADAYDGLWLPLHWLAQRVMAAPAAVKTACDELAQAQLLQLGQVDGYDCAGVHVDAESRLCTDPGAPDA